MTVPEYLGVWVCPSGEHRALDVRIYATGPTPLCNVDGTPLCAGRQGGACGDCRMKLHTYRLTVGDRLEYGVDYGAWGT